MTTIRQRLLQKRMGGGGFPDQGGGVPDTIVQNGITYRLLYSRTTGQILTSRTTGEPLYGRAA